MTKEKLADYLLFFAKFDYALSRAGFAKEGRKINEQKDIKTWEADWDKFYKKIPDVFFDEVKGKYQEILKNGGPKVWGKKTNEDPAFHDDVKITNNQTLIYACKHIRNNLIHGEKLETDLDSVKRNHKLLSEAKNILIEAMTKTKDIKQIFDDIA